MGYTAFLHRSGSIQAFPVDARRDHSVPPLNADQHEEKLETHLVGEVLGKDVSREDADNRLEQAEFVLWLHEDFQEFAAIEVLNEPKIAVQRTVDRALVPAKKPHAAAAQALFDSRRDDVGSRHGEKNSGRENRIDETGGAADHREGRPDHALH